MHFADVYLVSNKLQLIAQDQIARLQESLGIPLPVGYAEFMGTLGIGDYCGLLRVYEPERIVTENRKVRKLWHEYFFWEQGQDVLPRMELLKCLIFADTNNGDNVLYHTEITDRLFILPRHDGRIYWAPESFLNPLEWHSVGGIVEPGHTFKWFESYRDRQCLELFTSLQTLELNQLVTLVSEWWPDSEVHVLIDGDEIATVARVFVKAIGGNIQLDQDAEDGRVGVRIDYDRDSAREVSELANHLKTLGFYRVGNTLD